MATNNTNENKINEGNQKVLTSWFQEWSKILPAISTWLILLGLIVLVAATFIIIAMLITPKDDRNFAIYPYALLGLLLIIIIGVFFDRKNERDTKKREGTLDITNENKVIITEKTSKNVLEKDQNFTDSRLGFKMYYPNQENWQKPQYLEYKNFIIKLGLISNDTQGDEFINTIKSNHPYGNMVVKSDNIIFQYGEDLEIEFLTDSTTQEIEDYLKRLGNYLKDKGNELPTEEDKQDLRQKLFLGNLGIDKLNFSISLTIQIMLKSLSIDSMAKPNLPNLLKALIASTQEPIDQLSTFNDSIIWITRTKMLNVKVNNVKGNFSIYRSYKLIETKEKLILLQIQWSPESDSAIEIWNELRSMLDSFAVV